MNDDTTKKANTITEKILEECLEIHVTRHKQYGASEANFADIARRATRLSSDDKKFTTMDIAIVMVAVKEARYHRQVMLAQKHDKKRLRVGDVLPLLPENNKGCAQSKVLHDSLIDWINYIAIMENVRILTSCKGWTE